eukprot:767357-Hanusia_phi.AAC.6
MDEWKRINQDLSCQYCDKKMHQLTLPSKLGSLSVNMIYLVGDAMRLQSLYFHSMPVGHVGEQFT